MINYLKFCCEWVDKGAAATLLLLLLVSFLDSHCKYNIFLRKMNKHLLQ